MASCGWSLRRTLGWRRRTPESENRRPIAPPPRDSAFGKGPDCLDSERWQSASWLGVLLNKRLVGTWYGVKRRRSLSRHQSLFLHRKKGSEGRNGVPAGVGAESRAEATVYTAGYHGAVPKRPRSRRRRRRRARKRDRAGGVPPRARGGAPEDRGFPARAPSMRHHPERRLVFRPDIPSFALRFLSKTVA